MKASVWVELLYSNGEGRKEGRGEGKGKKKSHDIK